MKNLKNRFLALTALAFVPLAIAAAPAAHATPLTWNLNGITFGDGGTATGSFVFDATTGQVSTWSISVSGGNVGTFPPLVYTPANSTFLSLIGTMIFQGPLVSGSNGFREIRFNPTSPLTDGGGTVSLNQNGLGSVECYNCSPFRIITSGTLQAILDSDGDSVPDNMDLCPGTTLPDVPTEGLLPNHYVTDASGKFVTTADSPNPLNVTIQDTRGCSCFDILKALNLGAGEMKHGCSAGTIRTWLQTIGGGGSARH